MSLSHVLLLLLLLLPPPITKDKDFVPLLLSGLTEQCGSLATTPLSSMCFLYESCLRWTSFPPNCMCFLMFYLAHDIRKPRAPCGGFKSGPVTSAGPLWCHDADRMWETQLHRPWLRQRHILSCTRGRRARFRGCEKRGGIPFEAGSSAMRKSGPQ